MRICKLKARNRRLLHPRVIFVIVIVFSIAFTLLVQSGLQPYIATTPTAKATTHNSPDHEGRGGSDSDHYHLDTNRPPSSAATTMNTTVATTTTIYHIQRYRHHNVNRQKITNIRILGERHSGTTFFENYLKHCFPTIDVKGYFLTKKHWFQPTPKYIQEVANMYGQDKLMSTTTFVDDTAAVYMPQLQHQRHEQSKPSLSSSFTSWWDISQHSNPQDVFQNTLVITFFRNPYQWMEAMRFKPHHWPNHCNVTVKQRLNVQKYDNNNNQDAQRSNSHHRDRKRRLQVNDQNNDQSNLKQRRMNSIQPPPTRNKEGMPIQNQNGGKIITKGLYHMEPLAWKVFVTRPMILLEDEQSQNNNNNTNQLCQKGYPFGSISPCDYTKVYIPPHLPVPDNPVMRKYAARSLPASINDVVYELRRVDHKNISNSRSRYDDDDDDKDQDGDSHFRPYQHPLELRADKIRNFLSIPKYWNVGGFASIRYESIVGEDGAAVFIDELAKILDIPSAQCPSGSDSRPKHRPPRVLDHEFHNWITQHTDWTEEARIGYAPEDEKPLAAR